MSVSCAAMAREEYLNHLASVPLFSGCTTKELRDIAKATVELTLDQEYTLVLPYKVICSFARIKRATLAPPASAGTPSSRGTRWYASATGVT